MQYICNIISIFNPSCIYIYINCCSCWNHFYLLCIFAFSIIPTIKQIPRSFYSSIKNCICCIIVICFVNCIVGNKCFSLHYSVIYKISQIITNLCPLCIYRYYCIFAIIKVFFINIHDA